MVNSSFHGLREFNFSLMSPDLDDFLWKAFPSETPCRSLAIIRGHLIMCPISDSIVTSYYCPHFRMWLNEPPLLFSSRISNEHSPKLQIRSHSYLRAVSEVSINRSLDSLDPAGLLTSPKFRSRNESYMRAMSTISQVSNLTTSH